MLYEGIQIQTAQTSEPKTIPSPVGGLNGRDALANMAETDAYSLVNFFPGTSTVWVRPGCSIHQESLGSPVSSMETFGGAIGLKMLAFAAPKVVDVTVIGTPIELKTDLVGDEIVATMFSTVADNAQFLIMTTGADTPFQYDGTTITDLALTGNIDPVVHINCVCNYNGRLYFGTENRLGFYYLPPGQIQGALEWFDLGQGSLKGGHLQAIATFSEDAGDGPDDYILFITSRGEMLVFRGLDPGDADSWEIVGRYRAAEPIGRKCVLPYAGDVLLLTTEGVQQASQIRKLSDTRYEAVSLSSKLGDILLDRNANQYTYGWCMTTWPAGGMLFVNTPDTNNRAGKYTSFVMNTTTQAWTTFLGPEWNPQCFCVLDREIYFGRYDGTIRKVGGLYDNLKKISFLAKQAYNYFNTPQHKHFKWAQFLVRSEAPVVLASRLSVDYVENIPVTEPNPIGSGGGAEWDLSYWDTAMWGYGPFTQRWIAPYGNYGVAASHWLAGDISGASLEWYATEHVFEKATGLL